MSNKSLVTKLKSSVNNKNLPYFNKLVLYIDTAITDNTNNYFYIIPRNEGITITDSGNIKYFDRDKNDITKLMINTNLTSNIQAYYIIAPAGSYIIIHNIKNLSGLTCLNMKVRYPEYRQLQMYYYGNRLIDTNGNDVYITHNMLREPLYIGARLIGYFENLNDAWGDFSVSSFQNYTFLDIFSKTHSTLITNNLPNADSFRVNGIENMLEVNINNLVLPKISYLQITSNKNITGDWVTFVKNNNFVNKKISIALMNNISFNNNYYSLIGECTLDIETPSKIAVVNASSAIIYGYSVEEANIKWPNHTIIDAN